jgi:3-phosphoshikimate 1-carboxyvinyltransferase
MRVTIQPGGRVRGEVRVPGDKSIAHRWLILAGIALGTSEIHDLPPALDVRSTARCLSALVPFARGPLEALTGEPVDAGQPDSFTFNRNEPRPPPGGLAVRAQGRDGLQVPSRTLDCGNSGTTMRLLAGVLAACPFTVVLSGDESLRARPMERVAAPLREMGARLMTTDGHAPMEVSGGPLMGIRYEAPSPSAQVKSAILLAGLAAEGETTVREPAATRDHTERALEHLGAPVRLEGGTSVTVSAFQHGGFHARIPGDVSSAAFLVAAAVLTGSELEVHGVGLNPSRTHFLAVMDRMGIRTETQVTGAELGEPVGDLHVAACEGLIGTTVEPWEIPLVIDEVPVLAALAAHARSDSWFAGAGELRVKESDRLGGLADMLRALGGHAGVEGDDLVVAGGGLEGGSGEARGDHRMAMAVVVASLAARSPVTVEGIEAADVSFPGFVETLRALGARIEDRGSRMAR